MQSNPARQRSTLHRAMIFVWIVPLVIFCLLVLFAPGDVLERYSACARFVAWSRSLLRDLLPAIDPFGHADSTAFPQVARLAVAYASVWLPALFCITFVESLVEPEPVARALEAYRFEKKLLLVLGFPAFAVLGLYAFFVIPGDPGFAQGLTTSGRLGYALMGSLTVLFSGMGPGFLPSWVLSLFSSKRR